MNKRKETQHVEDEPSNKMAKSTLDRETAASIVAELLGKPTGELNSLSIDEARRSIIDPRFTTGLVLEGKSIDVVKDVIKLFCTGCRTNADAKNDVNRTLLQHFISFPIGKTLKPDEVHSLIELSKFLVESCTVDLNVRTYSDDGSVIHLLLQLLKDILNRETSQQGWTCATSRSIAESLLNLLCSICSSPSCPKNLLFRKDVNGNAPMHLWASLSYSRGQETESGDIDLTASNTEHSLESVLRDIGKQLLDKGAKVNTTNDKDERPLHMVRTITAADFLCKQGALPNEKDGDGNTPLLSLVKWNFGNHLPSEYYHYDNPEAVTGKLQWKELLSLGLNPQLSNNQGETVLSLLVQASAFVEVRVFLKATKEPCFVDSNGDTPLHVFCRHSKDHEQTLRVMKHLIPSCATIVNQTNNDNDTALGILLKRIADDLPCDVINNLLRYGALLNIPDSNGQTCSKLAAGNPVLTEMLEKVVKFHKVDVLLSNWKHNSSSHKKIFDLVAHGQRTLIKNQFYYYGNPIAVGGAFDVYAAINSHSGHEVALIRVPTTSNKKMPVYKVHHQNVMQLHATSFSEKNSDYLVSDLMEGNLEELLKSKVMYADKQVVDGCQDILCALCAFHSKGITHGHINPKCIFYTYADQKLQFQLLNIGQQTIDSYSSHWMAPEYLANPSNPTEAADVYSCGLVIHWLLSKGVRHFEPEAEDLLNLLLTKSQCKRVSADTALKHPFFWDRNDKQQFLSLVGNQIECHPKNQHKKGDMLNALDATFCNELKHKKWTEHDYIKDIYDRMKDYQKRECDPESASSLLRFISNIVRHAIDHPKSTEMAVYKKKVFLFEFPNLLIEVYKLVRMYDDWKSKPQITSFFEAISHKEQFSDDCQKPKSKPITEAITKQKPVK